ncbi:hypothetical protein CaCOL14_007536 [Colletotrichum acutatum]
MFLCHPTAQQIRSLRFQRPPSLRYYPHQAHHQGLLLLRQHQSPAHLQSHQLFAQACRYQKLQCSSQQRDLNPQSSQALQTHGSIYSSNGWTDILAQAEESQQHGLGRDIDWKVAIEKTDHNRQTSGA